jgi:hypothetical protein
VEVESTEMASWPLELICPEEQLRAQFPIRDISFGLFGVRKLSKSIHLDNSCFETQPCAQQPLERASKLIWSKRAPVNQLVAFKGDQIRALQRYAVFPSHRNRLPKIFAVGESFGGLEGLQG